MKSDPTEPRCATPDRGPVRPVRRASQALAGGLLLLVAAFSPGPLPRAVTDAPARPLPAPDSSGRGPAFVRAPELPGTAPAKPNFALLSDAEAWAYLPERVAGDEAPLPAWARILARTLPRTTAAMLELDHRHRAGSPIPPELRGQLRWAAARAGGCAYGEAYALADLRAAGYGSAADRLAAGGPGGLPEATQAALAFARKLTTAPRSLTDAEVARLTEFYGEKQVVAMVLLLAHAHFQDRLALALGLTVEPGGPLPPLRVRFARLPFGSAAAPRARRPAPAPGADHPGDTRAPADWAAEDLTAVRCELDRQRSRRPRIRLAAAGRGANRWGMVGQTYQPALSTAWSSCTQAFGEEADQDPVFEQSLFWVVTRTKGCFY